MSYSKTNTPALTKLQQAYWEAKHNLNNSLGISDDDCWISTDADMDGKIRLLQGVDNSYNELLAYLLRYKRALSNLMTIEDNLGSALVEYGIKDSTEAGHLMILSGRAISRSANQKSLLKSNVMELFHEVQTFHFKATSDVLQTVSRMEKVRKSYRSGLMWLKNESADLDPDVSKKMKKFRKVQEHIKNLKISFDASKLSTMQKIDLYLLSRCNLFSTILVHYRDNFCNASENCALWTGSVVQKIPSLSSFKFKTLKELNKYSEQQSVEELHQQNSKLKRKPKFVHKPRVIPKQVSKNRQLLITSDTLKTQTSKTIVHKTVTFKNIAEHNRTDKNPLSCEQLINLEDDEENIFIQTKECFKNFNFIPGKYSEDLLSLKLEHNNSGDTNKLSVDNKEFQDEFEKDFKNLLNSVDKPLREANEVDKPLTEENEVNQTPSDLHFWSLIENFVDLKDSCESKSKVESPISPTKVQQENSVSKWENILLEFDPYNESISNYSNTNVVKEEC